MAHFFTPFRVVLLFAAIALFSISLIPSLRADLLPENNSQRLHVSVHVPRSNPLLIEQQVTSLLENGLSQLPGLKRIASVSRTGKGIVTLEFDSRSAIQQRSFEIAGILRQLSAALPVGAGYPVISGGSESQSEKSPLLVYTINAPQQPFMIRQQAYHVLNKLLAGTPDVREVLVTGAPQLQLSIVFDMEQCRSLGVTPDGIMKLLRDALRDGFPGYAATGNGLQYFLYVASGAPDIGAIENIALPLQHAVIRLKNVAKVYLEEQEARQFFRVNGKNSVFASIYVQEGVNRIAMAKTINQLLSSPQLWPQGYEALVAHDDAAFLREELQHNYRRILLSLGILMLFVFITYRNLRHLAVLLSALAINTCLTIILVRVSGIGVHLYTIAGMAISFGIVLDTLIIMLDYFRQFRNRRVVTAMLASAAILISSLLLVYLLPEREQNNLKDLAVVVCLSLISSLAVSLWFVPGLYVLLHARSGDVRQPAAYRRKVVRAQRLYGRALAFIARRKIIFCAALVLLFGLPVMILPSKWEREWWYGLLGGTSNAFVRNMRESGGFRDPGQTKLYVEAALPPGITPKQMNGIVQQAEQQLAGDASIDKFVTRVYDGQSALIEITFKKAHEHGAAPLRLKTRMVARSLEWGGVAWNVYGVGQAFSNTTAVENGRFSVTMKGYNYDRLEREAERLAASLRNNKRVHDINISEPLFFADKVTGEYALAMDPGKMALHQAEQAAVVAAILRQAPPSGASGLAAIGNTLYPVVLKEKRSGDYAVYDLLRQPLVMDSNRMVRLSDVASLDFRQGLNVIYREDRQYLRAVGFSFRGPEESGSRYLKNLLDTFCRTLPPGYTAIKPAATADAAAPVNYAFIVSLLIIASFFICSILFESLKQPLFIICTVPVSFIGLFIIFPLGDFFFDQGGDGAFVMLGGLVAGAAIFIVNDFNSLRKQAPGGRLYNKVLVKAVGNRSRTILLTTLSNVCGLIPFLLEGDDVVFWFSFALGTVAGLVFSLFALLVVLPVLLWRPVGVVNRR